MSPEAVSQSIALVSAGRLASDVDLLLFLVVGALAGAHCLGMCGPLVTTYADRISGQRETRDSRRVTTFVVRQHGLFNAGRTVGYTVVGAFLGLLGSVIVGAAATIEPIATIVRGGVGIVVGLFIIAAGASYLRRGTTATGILTGFPGIGRIFGRLTSHLTAKIDGLAGSTGIVGLGAIHALLPCPILYPAYLYAFAIGDPVRGALALGLLGVGTIPTLLAYGLALGSLSVGRRKTLHRAMGVVFLVLGYLPLAHGLLLFGVDLPYPNIPFYQPF